MPEDFCTGEALLIPGPAGDIDVLTACPDCYDATRPIAIISHPHPLYGGSMKNKVVYILAKTFNNMGLLSVSYNFRGVGRSAGSHDHGRGEVEDLLAVVAWFRERYPEAPLWLAGFSFGAYITQAAHVRAGADRVLLVAPPVSMYDFDEIPPIKEVPWMVIQGGKDEVIDPEAVSQWVSGQTNPPVYHWMADAGHFFHGRLNHVRDAVMAQWGEAAGQSA